MKNKLSIVLAMGLLLFGVGGVTHASLIDTTPTWDGSSNITSFGENNSATYGQTFLVTGPDTVLDSWTMYIDDFVNPDVVDFAFYVMDWNAATTRATGPILYQSSAVSTSNNGGAGGMEAFTFNTGGLVLSAGNDYVAFISATGLFDGSTGTSAVGSLRDESVYADGGFFWQNNGNTAGTWDTQAWSSAGNFGDLAFTASFSSAPEPVPEPATMLLLSTGLIGLAGFRRRFKK